MTPFSIEEVREIFEVRLLIEPSLIQETVKRLQKDGVKELKTALKEHRSAHRDYYFAERLFKKQEVPHDTCILFREGTPDQDSGEYI
jgi:DNA-binding GntR family transcriptional regulator